MTLRRCFVSKAYGILLGQHGEARGGRDVELRHRALWEAARDAREGEAHSGDRRVGKFGADVHGEGLEAARRVSEGEDGELMK